MTAAISMAATSETTARAVRLVAERRPTAAALGRRLAESSADPDAFAAALRSGLEGLADPDYRAGQQLIAPGIGRVLGVRSPLLVGVARGFRSATRHDRPSQLLFLADRLFREEPLELRWFAIGLLERTLAAEPERTWQLLRRAGRDAGDWITVDTLARAWARGILGEPYRWAELDQLVYAPSRWERRLVGSTIASVPFVDRRAGRDPAVARRALDVIRELIGDADPDVQKALAWALRSLVLADAAAVTAFVEREATTAAATDDGHRAWVVRDVLAKLEPAVARRLREQLAGIRRRPGAPATSRATDIASRFAGMGIGRAMPEPPLA